MFKKLKITGWQQFGDIEIPFHRRMTIITGANGSGKTTILKSILASHFGWSSMSLAVPRKNLLTSTLEWFSGLLDKSSDDVGEIIYDNDVKAVLHAPLVGQAQYTLTIRGQQNVEGFFIPSHRSTFNYQQLGSLPLRQTFSKEDAFLRISESVRNRYSGGGGAPSSYHMKEILVSWNIFGYGNPVMPGREDLLQHFRDFENVLKVVLPKSLGFRKLEIRDQEIVFCCDSGEFLLDAASGGISTMIDLAWQIHMFSTDKRDNFVVVIDEVENHLHPTMQRRILSDLLKAFPKASFVISTHSPLIVTSVRDSTVVALRYKEGKVYSEVLDLVDKPRTATEVLDEVLGVSFTMPIWAEEDLARITKEYTEKKDLTKEDLLRMRDKLKEIGLERLMPEAIYRLAEDKAQ
jgi:hypothetical protein